MSKPVLNQTTRAILEDFGVMPAPKVPPLDALVSAVRERGGSVQVTVGDAGASATVRLSGEPVNGQDGSAALALAEALAQALLAEPMQTRLFGGDGTLSDEQRARLERLRRDGGGAGEAGDGGEA